MITDTAESTFSQVRTYTLSFLKTEKSKQILHFCDAIFHNDLSFYQLKKKKKNSFQIPQKLGPYLILSRPERRFLFFSNKNR